MRFKRLESRTSPSFTFTWNGHVIEAAEGDTIASALLVAGITDFRVNQHGHRRGPYCLMGACFECLVEIDGLNVQSCMTPVVDGMRVTRVRVAQTAEWKAADE